VGLGTSGDAEGGGPTATGGTDGPHSPCAKESDHQTQACTCIRSVSAEALSAQ
jgi:hypothetical protein